MVYDASSAAPLELVFPIPSNNTMADGSDSYGRLDGRKALVTGSSSGIGRAIALELASAGAEVVLHGRSESEPLRAVRDQILQQGGACHIAACDLGQMANCEPFVRESWERHQPIDIWINNAGADTLTGAAKNLPFDEKLNRLLEVDLKGTMLLSRAIGRFMKDQGRGTILNIGWDQSDRGMAGESGELFAAVKNGIMGFTRSLSLSLAPEVRVNCIAPGWIKTAWGNQASETWQQRVLRETPLARWGTPEDIARLARFLVSEEASYITGQVINANGGAVR